MPRISAGNAIISITSHMTEISTTSEAFMPPISFSAGTPNGLTGDAAFVYEGEVEI